MRYVLIILIIKCDTDLLCHGVSQLVNGPYEGTVSINIFIHITFGCFGNILVRKPCFVRFGEVWEAKHGHGYIRNMSCYLTIGGC